MNIIGVGQPGCRVTKQFEKFPQYKLFFIDTKKQEGYKNFYKVTQRPDHEEYEEKYKRFNFKSVKGDVTIVISGAGRISGILLRLLEQFKNENLKVLYIKPDMRTADPKMIKREKTVFGILQQYARSNLLSNLYVVSNPNVEAVFDSVNISTYWDDINNVISSTYHMINVFENTEPILSTIPEVSKTNKIVTLGAVSYENLDEKLFYNLEKTRVKKYFFGVSENTLNEEKDLLHKIRDYVNSKSKEFCSVGFAIYPTNYEENYVYTAHYASFIQEQNLVDN